MAKRVKQHQIEDLSRSKFCLVLPKYWVIRDKEKDYGIDIEVEIFDKNDRSTGLVYWVQIKATESVNKSVIRKVDLNIDSIKYYKSLEIPVLIVRYSEKEDRFYCRWIYDIDLFYAKKGGKTIRILFCDRDIWGVDSADKTIEFLKKIRAIKTGAITLPVSIFMKVKNDSINEIPRGIFMSAYRLDLQNYSQIALYESDPKKSILHVSLKEDELVISLSSVTGCTFHRIKDRGTKGFTEGIVADVLLGLAASLANIGQNEIAARIFLDSRLKIRFFQKRDLLYRFLPSLIMTSRYGEVIDAVCEIIDSDDDDMLENTTTISAIVLIYTNDQDKNSKLEKLLYKCLSKNITLEKNSHIGISHYNLGNHFHNRGANRKSITHYLLARRFEPKYLNQSYYYQELGGSLFELGKYRFSANFYKIALDKGAPNSVKPLYADALMFSGYYKLSLEVFSEYLDSVTNAHTEWYLKRICLEVLIDTTSVEEQVRRKKEAISKIDISKAGDPTFISDLKKAVDLDNLCGLAWFNLGIFYGKSGKYEDASFSFITCGLVQRWDIEAWINATICCFNKDVPYHIFPLVLSTAYFFNGDNFLSSLHEKLKDRCDGDMLEKLTNAIDEILPKIKKDNQRPKIRLLHSDGLFRDIFTGENA